MTVQGCLFKSTQTRKHNVIYGDYLEIALHMVKLLNLDVSASKSRTFNIPA